MIVLDKKKMKPLAIFLLGINSIIGSGVFLLGGELYSSAGNLSLLSIFLAAVTVLLIVFCYADLAGKTEGDGSAWLYTYTSFGKYWGSLIGFFSWILGVATLSAEVTAIFILLKEFFPIFKQTTVLNISAIILLVGLGILNYFGPKITTFADNLSSASKILVLAGFVLIGIFFIKLTNFSLPPIHNTTQGAVAGVEKSFTTVFYMFTGFSFLPIAANEMVNPEKNLPRALFRVIGAVTVIYIAVQFINIGLLGDNLKGATLPVAQAAKQLVGQTGYTVILMGMLISILGITVSVSFNTPILLQSMAAKQLLPKQLQKENAHGAPTIAIILSIAVSCVLILSGSYLFLVSCIVFMSFVQYIATILATIKNKKNPDVGFKLPFGYVIPVISLAVTLFLMKNVTSTIWLFGLVVFVFGNLCFFVNKKVTI
jgi:amino acid transporter